MSCAWGEDLFTALHFAMNAKLLVFHQLMPTEHAASCLLPSPPAWLPPTAAPSPTHLQLHAVLLRSTGTLPQNWGIEETSMRELGVM